MHLLPDSRHLGCATVGAHIHVRHRANSNGALAKSRFPRSVPASDAVLSSYADYQHERAGLAGDDGTDLVLVNLYHEPAISAASDARRTAEFGLLEQAAPLRGAGRGVSAAAQPPKARAAHAGPQPQGAPDQDGNLQR
jgi:hypothetical protein